MRLDNPLSFDAEIERFLRAVGSARDVEISRAMAPYGSPDAMTIAMLGLLEAERVTYTGEEGPLDDVRYSIADPD